MRWTSPTGRTRLSPAQHEAPVPDPQVTAPAADPLEHLGPIAREHELHPADAYFDGLDTDTGLLPDTRVDEAHWAADMALLRRWAAEDTAA